MTATAPGSEYIGLLMIGDPHVEGRVPGFRRDDYPSVVLDKLKWCLDYATEERLLPVILGDLFHLPRDNPNWLLSELMQLLDREVLGVYGNHDVRANELTNDDSLNVIVTAGRMRLLDSDHVCRKTIGGRPVVIGGTPWGQPLPSEFQPGDESAPLVFWVSHHDLVVPGYEMLGKIAPCEIPGIDVVVNGHVHNRLQTVGTGRTLWMTPGNISRRVRNGATRSQVPSVLRMPRLKLTGRVLPISYVQARKAPESPKEPGGANCAKEYGRGLPARVFRRGCDGVRLTRLCRSLRLARTGEDSEPPARSRTRER